MTKGTSYAQILKSSSVMGGAAGITMLLSLVRTKCAAILIGTTGIGLLASFTSIQRVIGVLFGVGIQSSAVREVAAASGRGDEQAIGRTVLTLRRICWITGLTGMAIMVVLSPLISLMTFGGYKYSLDIAALGLVILLGNLTGGQLALIQGVRRIGDMARANIIGATLGTISTISLYYWLGLRGLVPALIVLSAFELTIAFYYARRIPFPPVQLTWIQTIREANSMIRLGLVFMWNSLLGAVVSYLTVMLISQQISLEAVGLYSAAFALSSILVSFVLSAMAADYYPRLTSVSHDKVKVNQLANEQTQIGLLLALPGLLASLTLAPWIINLFYSNEFMPAVQLLQWFILGCFGRVVSWPIGYILIARKELKLLFFVETSAEVIHLFLIVLGLHVLGLQGVAVAFFFLLIFTTIILGTVTKKVTGFAWARKTKGMITAHLVLLISTLVISSFLPSVQALVFGCVVSLLAFVFSAAQFVLIIKPDSVLSMRLKKIYDRVSQRHTGNKYDL